MDTNLNDSNDTAAANTNRGSTSDLRLIGFQASEEFRTRLKIAAARRGMSMKDALHEAVDLWIRGTEDKVLFDEDDILRGSEANQQVRARRSSEYDVTNQSEILEDEDEDELDPEEVDKLFDDEEALSHGDDLIVDPDSDE